MICINDKCVFFSSIHFCNFYPTCGNGEPIAYPKGLKAWDSQEGLPTQGKAQSPTRTTDSLDMPLYKFTFRAIIR